MDNHDDMDTPSSEDSSPKSSFNSKANSPAAAKLGQSTSSSSSAADNMGVRSKLTKLLSASSSSSSSSIKSSLKQGLPVSSLIASETDHIRSDIMSIHQAQSQAQQHPAAFSKSTPDLTKPPVPSRAGVNRILQKQATGPKVAPRYPPPAPPVRTSSISGKSKKPLPDPDQGEVTSTSTKKVERMDSGRESDLDRSSSFGRDDLNLSGLSVSSGTVGSPPLSRVSGDEGFSSSHEDKPPVPPPRSTSTPRSVTNHHRDVQKPSEVKLRSKFKSTSNLGTLEETHHGGRLGEGGDAVSYWSGPYL